uniref:Cytochrome c oxidase subunit 3 n=1 Tax=Groenewaldozyma salmanticensis TaxID=49332 RepID=E5L082_9ASCO|nr:cytochrome c oxidase subunit 3 [Groenewaldozyma salmanticensis]ADO51047.1 cytochrome c oxidase subunit 3 [Groenewaldozyma salmanticensis]
MKFLYKHGNHLVEPSLWPIITSFSIFGLLFNLALSSHGYIGNPIHVILSVITLFLSVVLWTRDVVIEGTYLGQHTLKVRKGLILGYILFLISEVMFFVGIFWAYIHSSMGPTVEIGSMWPPIDIASIGPLELPLFNTIILLSSGATITYSHHSLLANNYSGAVNGLLITVLLAVLFLICQFIEYKYATFTISDGVYGSCFFLGTGWHGMHVIIGTLFLTACLLRMVNYHFTSTHHVGYECTIFLWHVVDVVWLVLYVLFYFWGS